MFIAHLPAGYLATTPLLDRAAPPAHARRAILLAGLFASVAPDLDLLYFYLLSDGGWCITPTSRTCRSPARCC